ncbi:response regulator transcription factor [Bradyrhizobium sp. JYMT SZCCT0180]|uniref:response regulator transcription factor n=1 Tax=Bradyrhizobium sp. JYMT SZCCT0180 TaxID=2807666 RepID=UPI001BA98C0B|nr:response regulator transcription factor [Bradyrhizobium sp. JYMT SZCCT0180]MBR1215572.1 response regulator transcription factor [Bradyrhizobium sp. JYMT SZCCT0180]
MRRIRLVIADRRPIVLQGFASLLAAERDFEVVASCLNGTSCLEAIRNLTPDVVLVEDGFSDVTATELLTVADAENFSTRLVLYTASVARGDVADAIAEGVCNAISMRAKPETVLNSLRLVAPRPDRTRASKEENGAIGEDVLAALTNEERKVMRLVAYGLSNKGIARQLNVSPGAVKADLDRIFQKLPIGNRSELTAVVLSRLSGGIGVLAALIIAALDDGHAANANELDDTLGGTFTVMVADGTAEVAAITITPRKSVGALGVGVRAAFKAGRVDNPGNGRATPAVQLVDSSFDITSSTVTLTTANSARLSVGSSSAFMMVAAGVLIYELDHICRPAQAFDFGNSLTEVSTSAAANGSKELVAFNISGTANANNDGFDDLAWQRLGKYDQSFAFDSPRSQTISMDGDELQIVSVDAREDGASDHGKDRSLDAKSANEADNRIDTISKESVSALAGHPMDHGGFGETTKADTSQNFGHGKAILSAGEHHSHEQSQRNLHASDGSAAAEQHAKNDPQGSDLNHGQSQRDLHASDGSAAAKQHAKNDPQGNDLNHGQSQRDLHASDGSAAAKQHAKNDPQGSDLNHGQSQHDLHASDGSAAAKQHAKNDPQGNDLLHGQSQHDLHASDGSAAHAKLDATPEIEVDRGQSQRDSHAVPANAGNHLHSGSGLNAGGKDKPTDDTGQVETAAAPAFGDSFHFKKEMVASKASDVFELHVGHGPDSTEHGLHIRHDGLAPEAHVVGLSLAEQDAVDHAKGAKHHLTPDLFV